MVQSPAPLHEDLITALRDMKEATGLLSEVVKSVKLDNQGTPPQELADIKRTLGEPTWNMVSKNALAGVINGDPVKLEAAMDFSLATGTLFTAIDRQKHFDPALLDSTLEKLKSRPEGKALAEILLSSLLPHTYGLTNRISLLEVIPALPDPGPVEEIVELMVRDGLVHINYAHTLSRFLPLSINLDQALFAAKVWVNAEFLAAAEPFTKKFFWEDPSNGDPLTVSINLAFTRL